jgi:hypothetical protein
LEELGTGVPMRSKGAERLLTAFGWGLISANFVRWICEGLVEDGPQHYQICELAQLGASGKYKGNVRRDLVRKWCPRLSVPKPFQMPVHILGKLKVVKDSEHPIINPMEITEQIYRHFPALFKDIFGTDHLRAFWDQDITTANE